MYSLSVPEARSPRPKCQQGHVPPQALGISVFQTSLLASDSSLSYDSIIPVFTWSTLPIQCLSLQTSLLLRSLVMLDEGPILLQYDLILINYPPFQVSSQSEVFEVKVPWVEGEHLEKAFVFTGILISFKKRKKEIKDCPWRTSLMVQWLKLCLPMQGVWVPSLVRELRSHMPHSHKTKT